MSPVNLWYLINNVKCFHGHFTHYYIALVYDPVKPNCFNSQVNIYLHDCQSSKTVFILARSCPNKLFKSLDKGCLILVPRSDLFRPFFMGLIVLKYRIFCPFSAKMQDESFNFFMLSSAKMAHFFLNPLFFR